MLPEILSSRNASQNTLHDADQQDDAPTHEAIQERYDNPSSYRFRRVGSKTVVSFGPDDPENPVNWSKGKKYFALFAGMMQVMNSTISSSLPSGAISYLADHFHVTNQEQLVLPISVFLVGYVIGPLFCGPLSEEYGRKRPLLIGFILFNVFSLACALAPSFSALLVFRLLNGMAAAAPIAIVSGMFADIYNDPTERGRTMAYFMACTTFGPIISPWASGFIAPVSWRWAFWLGFFIALVSLPLVIFLPETYAPVLLQRRAARLRKETGNASIVAPFDLTPRNLRATLTVTLTRPIRMIIHESIVSFTCLYLALAYAIFYLYFQAYPIVFQDIHGMSAGIAGLCYLPIGLGVFIACGIFIWYDGFLVRAKARGAKWSQIEEYRRLPLACIGGPLYVVSLFWVGWTASPHIHWAVPLVSGIFFGLGYMLIFMAMLNYLSDAYETFAASAQSASSCTRSICGAVLPLAAKPMFDRLGIDWGCSLVAFLSLGVSIIPFAFIRFGDYIRRNSKFCQHLKELKEAEQRAWGQDAPAGSAAGDGDIEKAVPPSTTAVDQDGEESESARASNAAIEKELEKQMG
ncbi:hypothetical protein VTN77DRAFT_9743 [Rasamsonia byssochlamydoides]|uniref:uncharacterized protein n=1 Tax=Rasamsonia byssochlamydoides TaxID=89139 RepID=UPI0037433269